MRDGSPLYGGSSRERKRRSARVRGLGSRRGGRIRSRRSVTPRNSRKGPSWPDRRSGLAAAQALARARRFCSFFFRAARMRAVLFRRLGARFFAGIVASYPFLGGFRWSGRPRRGQLDRNARDPAGRRFARTPALAPAVTAPRTRSPLMGAWRASSGLPSSQTGKGMSISACVPALFATTASGGFPRRPFCRSWPRSARVAEYLDPDLEVPAVRHGRGGLLRVLGDVGDERFGRQEE